MRPCAPSAALVAAFTSFIAAGPLRRQPCMITARIWALSPLPSSSSSIMASPELPGTRQHSASGIEPCLGPGASDRAAAKLHPVVQAVGPVVPELHDQRVEPVARPVGRPRHGADRV